MQDMCLPNMRSWFSGSCSFTVMSYDYWAFGCPVWMPLFLRGVGEWETSLTLSPLLCPGAEEFVVVILKMLAGQEVNFPPCSNDVFPHVPTIQSLLYSSMFVGCGSVGIWSAQSWSLRLVTWLEKLGGYPSTSLLGFPLHWMQAVSGDHRREHRACLGLWHGTGMSTAAQPQQLRRN